MRLHRLLVFLTVFILLPSLALSHVAAPPRQNPGDTGKPCPTGTCCEHVPGAPVWQVNPINTNLYIADIPLWYEPAIGPEVTAQLYYNSIAAATGSEIFGNKWGFRYSGNLVIAQNDTISITMADGKHFVFNPDDNGGYTRNCNCDAPLELVKLSPASYTLTAPNGTTWLYATTIGETIYLTSITDIHGQALTIGYADDKLTTITDALGQTTTLHYNGDNLVEKITDPFGREALFGYDGNRNLISLTDIGGYATTVEYDQNSLVTALVNEGGRTQFYIEPATPANSWTQYPAPGAVMGSSSRITITNPEGSKQEYFYDGVSATFWYVAPGDYREYDDAVNNLSASVPKTVYTYANTVRGTRANIASISYPGGEKTIYTYDSTTGKLSSIADAAGNTRLKTYNDKGRITTATRPNGAQTRYTYGANGIDLITIEDDLGNTSMTYDAKHQVTSITDRSGNQTQFQYNPYGQLSSITDPLGISTTLTYNQSHQLTEIHKANQLISRFSHDPIGRVTTSLDSTGLQLSYGYDDFNHVTTITWPDGKNEQYSYGSPHSPHLVTRLVSRSGKAQKFSYNPLKGLSQLINQEGGLLEYGYDPAGSLTTFTGANRNTTSFAYDPGGRLTSKTYADGTTVQYSYNNRGLVETSTNGRGQVSSYYYDENGNLLSVDYGDATPDLLFTYDTYDRLVKVEDGSGVTRFTYDSGSRLLQVDGPLEQDTLTYGYDSLNRVTSVHLENGITRSYSYDNLGRLSQVQAGTGVYSYSFINDSSPLIATLTRPNSSQTQYLYDGLNRMLEVKNTGSSGVINSYTYRYNNEDLRDQETIIGGLALPQLVDHKTASSYNTVNQLVEKSTPDQSFSYDQDGNMVAGYTPEGYAFTAVYDQVSRLVAFSYTDDQSIRHRIAYSYRYDDFLAGEKRYENDTLISDIRYIRDGHLVIQERDGANSVINEYVWGSNLGGGIGGLLQLTRGSDTYYYLYDGKGNVVAVLDENQAFAAQYRYSPFGVLTNQSGTLDQPFQFSSKRYDPATGLNYYGYRFYSPNLGRWINRDPLGEAGGINLYGFVENDPINWIDPWGLYTEVVQWGRSPGRAGRWGHISGNINGQNWSFGPGGWDTKYPNFSDYAARQADPDIDRGGRGIVLDLSPAEEVQLQQCLQSYDDYNGVTNNCGNPWVKCLEKLGIADSSDKARILPYDIYRIISASPRVNGSTNYPGTHKPVGAK